MEPQELILSLMILMILAGVALLWMAMSNRRRFREMEHRERLAMIQHGIVPSPEMDPAAFEIGTGLAEPESRSAARSRSIGIVMIGIGLALMMLISFAAGAPEVGLGVGGAFALLGATFVVNGLLGSRSERSDRYNYPAPSPRRQPPPDQPSR